jgi:lipopolysaccharide export system protein LptC
VKDRWRAWVPALLLSLLAALTWWLDQKVQPVGPHDSGSSADPDFVAENFEAKRMNEDGTERYSVVAQKMEHYPADNSATLEEPRLTHFDPDKGPVSIRANHGAVSSNGETVDFRDAVLVRRAPFNGDPEMTLTTTFLHVIPDKDLVMTDREVTLTHGNSTVNSVGLEFNNKTRQLKLLSNVKGQLQTPQKGSRAALSLDRKR